LANLVAALEALHNTISDELRELGLTDADLKALRLKPSPGLPFSQWSFRWGVNLPVVAAFPLLRAFCTAKWLREEEPSFPSSPWDKEDGRNYLISYIAAPTYEAGTQAKEIKQDAHEAKLKLADVELRDRQSARKLSELQSRRATGRREVADGKTMREIVARVVKGHPEEETKELWPHFESYLERLGLSPQESSKPDDPSRTIMSYDIGNRRKEMTLKRFANLVSEIKR
jgi:hypothetical protein